MERLFFDSDALPEADRLDRYRALYAAGSDVTTTGPAPRAAVTGWRLDRVLLYDRHLHQIEHARDAGRVARDGMTHLTATLVTGGEFAIDGGDGWRAVAPGELVLFDMLRPMRSRSTHAKLLTISIAGDRAAELGSVAALHLRVLPEPATRLLRGFLATLVAELPQLDRRSIAAVTGVLISLLRVSLEHGGVFRAQRPGRVRDVGADLRRLRTLIDDHLGDPRLDAERLAGLAQLSRATLYRVAAPFGGVADLIRARRLEKVRLLLSQGGGRAPLAEIAERAGWRSESHLSRSFQQRFGLRPGAYRTQAERLNGDAPVHDMHSWVDELR